MVVVMVFAGSKLSIDSVIPETGCPGSGKSRRVVKSRLNLAVLTLSGDL